MMIAPSERLLLLVPLEFAPRGMRGWSGGIILGWEGRACGGLRMAKTIVRVVLSTDPVELLKRLVLAGDNGMWSPGCRSGLFWLTADRIGNTATESDLG